VKRVGAQLHDQRFPLLAFGIALLGTLTAAVMYGVNPFQASSWLRWDAALYMQIADHGYQYFHCTPGLGSPDQTCGNAGWFPAYPYAAATVRMLTPLTTVQAGAAVSWLFSLGIVLVLWNTFLGRRTDGPALVALAFGAFAPGAVYRFAIFPMSMLAFFAILSLWWATQRRWVLSGVAGALTGATYHLGALIVPILVIYALIVPAGSRRDRFRNAGIAGGLAALGPVIVFVIMRLQTGAWDAFFKTQAKYNHHLRNPITGFWDEVKHLFDGHLLTGTDIPAIQVLLTTGLVVLLVAFGVRAWRRQPGGADVLLVMWAVVMWIAPLCQTDVALYRNYALLTPAAPLLTRLPLALSVALVAAFAWITIPLFGLFWNRILV
jgi:hypothetical protein